MRERNISDVFLEMGIRDFPGLQHDYNESQSNRRGTDWPLDIPIPFEEFQKLLVKQLELPAATPMIFPTSADPEYISLSSSPVEKIEKINTNTIVARICQAKYLLSESPRQYELNEDLEILLEMFQWDGALDINCLNRLEGDCIAIHWHHKEEAGELERFWFVFRDLLQQQIPILVIVLATAPQDGGTIWNNCVYEIPLIPGKIRENIRYRDVRRIRSRYPISTPADTKVISEQKLLESYLDNLMEDLQFVIPLVHHICSSPLDLKDSKKIGNVQLVTIETEFADIHKSIIWRKTVSERY